MLSCTPRVALYLCGDWYKHTSRKPTDVIMRPKNHNHESYQSPKNVALYILAQANHYAKWKKDGYISAYV